MARVVVGSWMVRYPLGGNLSWTLQWLVGFQALGHEVFLVEKAGYPDACFDPVRGVMSDDGSHGVRVVASLLARFGLDGRLCFVDAAGRYHGLARQRVREAFDSADLFLDIGTHGNWLPEAGKTRLTALLDGEPGSTQMKMERERRAGSPLPEYDRYFTNGLNVGTPAFLGPTAGKAWEPLFNPVSVDLFGVPRAARDAPFTTVMNWKAHQPFVFDGVTYGQKDAEFARFLDLPRRAGRPMEVAVSGDVPAAQLAAAGWSVRGAHEVTASYDSYVRYIADSRGEFSVCKHVYVATRSGWFSDRSAAYLAAGRPVVLQDTGFSAHLPCGEGLHAVATVDDAAAAIEAIDRDYPGQSRRAREIARDYLDTRVVIADLLARLGL